MQKTEFPTGVRESVCTVHAICCVLSATYVEERGHARPARVPDAGNNNEGQTFYIIFIINTKCTLTTVTTITYVLIFGGTSAKVSSLTDTPPEVNLLTP